MHKKKEIKLKELSEIINASVTGDENYIIDDISEPESADERSIIFFSNKRNLEKTKNSKAKAVLTSKNLPLDEIKDKILLIADDLEISFIKLLDFFQYKEAISFTISKKAVIGKNVKIEEKVHIDDNVVIKDNCSIAEGAVIYPSVCIGHDVAVGKGTIIYPNVTIYDGTVIGNNVIIHGGTVIGSDGFGYTKRDGKNIKIPHIGNVIIEDNVEIGSNSLIDRGSIGSTVIKKGVKIDDLVVVAHNVTIGENTVIVALTGISGSVTIGKNCILAGQVGVADHVVIEDNIIVGAKAGIPPFRVVKSKEKMIWGIPARPILKAKRISAIMSKLPEIYQEIIEIKKKIKKL